MSNIHKFIFLDSLTLHNTYKKTEEGKNNNPRKKKLFRNQNIFWIQFIDSYNQTKENKFSVRYTHTFSLLFLVYFFFSYSFCSVYRENGIFSFGYIKAFYYLVANKKLKLKKKRRPNRLSKLRLWKSKLLINYSWIKIEKLKCYFDINFIQGSFRFKTTNFFGEVQVDATVG